MLERVENKPFLGGLVPIFFGIEDPDQGILIKLAKMSERFHI